MTAIEAYFGVVLTKIKNALNHETVPESIVILADDSLLELPLEALSIFNKPEIKSLSRDFSLQMFYHRYKQGECGKFNCKCFITDTNKVNVVSYMLSSFFQPLKLNLCIFTWLTLR